MLRSNGFPISETQIKKVVFGEARALSGSFEIKLLAPLVFSQSAAPEMKKCAFLSPKKAHFIGYRYNPFKSYTHLSHTLAEKNTIFQLKRQRKV